MRVIVMIGSLLVGTALAVAIFAMMLPVVAAAVVFAIVALVRAARRAPEGDSRRGDFDAAA